MTTYYDLVNFLTPYVIAVGFVDIFRLLVTLLLIGNWHRHCILRAHYVTWMMRALVHIEYYQHPCVINA